MSTILKKYNLANHPILKNILIAIFFGIISNLFSEIKLQIPGSLAASSNLREIPILLSVVFLPHWSYMFIVGLVSCLSVIEIEPFISTLIIHFAAAIVAWFGYRYINYKIKKNILFGVTWVIFVFLLYLIVFLPIFIFLYSYFGLYEVDHFFASMQDLLQSLRYEILTTSIISALFIVIVRMNKVLKERIQWHDLVLRNANLGFWSRNLENNSVLYHQQWAKMIGYTIDEIQNNTTIWRSLLHPDDKDKALATLNRFIEGESEIYISEYRLKTKTGEWRWILDQGQAIERNSNGKVLRCAGTHLDITDRVKMQEIMIQNEKMMSIGGLAAGMAHEINNPLAGMMQSASVILNRLTKNSPKNKELTDKLDVDFEKISAFLEERKIIKMVRLIIETGQRASEIIANMLSFSRKSESKFKEIDIAKTIDDTIKLVENNYDMKKEYDFRHIKIIKNYQPSLPHLFAQESKIKQVVMNILKNGAEAMAEAGEKEKPFKTPQFLINLRQENNHIRIEIENNGPAIPEKIKKRIFEPFFTTKDEGKGTGLGLSISYFIITKDHGGELYIESDKSFGVRFVIRLPIHRK